MRWRIFSVALVIIGSSLTIPANAGVETTCFGKQATILGTELADDIRGTIGSDVIVALGGDDVIHADQGSDYICAGDGNDTVVAGDGYDRLEGGAGDDVLRGGKRPDYFYPGPGADRIDGGYEYGYGYGGGYSGNYWDFVVYSDLDELTIDLKEGWAEADGRDELVDIEAVIGTSGDDVIQGGDTDDRLLGGDGNDVLAGGLGDDDLLGGEGDDELNGGDGTDSIAFEVHGEVIAGPVTVALEKGKATGQGKDTVRSVETVFGTLGDDVIKGDAAANRFFGHEGSDLLIGLEGNDVCCSATSSHPAPSGMS